LTKNGKPGTDAKAGEQAAIVGISLSAYAKHRGVSKQAVSKAVERERLKQSVVIIDGRPRIANVELADREWAQNTDLSRAPGYVKARESSPPSAPPVAFAPSPEPRAPSLQPDPSRPQQPSLPDGGAVHDPLDPEARWNLKDASSEEKKWKALLAQLEYKERDGELVPAKDVEVATAALFTNVRTKLLAVPGKARAAAPHLTLSDVALLESLIRETLEELSTMDPPKPVLTDGAAA
jgi:hypothetical protein